MMKYTEKEEKMSCRGLHICKNRDTIRALFLQKHKPTL